MPFAPAAMDDQNFRRGCDGVMRAIPERLDPKCSPMIGTRSGCFYRLVQCPFLGNSLINAAAAVIRSKAAALGMRCALRAQGRAYLRFIRRLAARVPRVS